MNKTHHNVQHICNVCGDIVFSSTVYEFHNFDGNTQHYKIFKSITCDNGSEFKCSDAIERSDLGNYKRTEVFYCHPYSSCERGSNEKQNQMIRRWIHKGTKIEQYSDEYIQNTARWLNDYPRPMFDFQTSRDLFEIELKKLGVKFFA